MDFPVLKNCFSAQLPRNASGNIEDNGETPTIEQVLSQLLNKFKDKKTEPLLTIMSAKTIDLARIFNLENYIADRRMSLLSASGFSEVPPGHDADFSEKLKLWRAAIRKGKLFRRADGSPMPDHEIMAMPLDRLKDLFVNTPDGEMEESENKISEHQQTTLSASRGLSPRRSLAKILDEENERNYGRK